MMRRDEDIGAHSGDLGYDYDYVTRTPSLIKAMLMMIRRRRVILTIIIIMRRRGLQ